MYSTSKNSFQKWGKVKETDQYGTKFYRVATTRVRTTCVLSNVQASQFVSWLRHKRPSESFGYKETTLMTSAYRLWHVLFYKRSGVTTGVTAGQGCTATVQISALNSPIPTTVFVVFLRKVPVYHVTWKPYVTLISIAITEASLQLDAESFFGDEAKSIGPNYNLWNILTGWTVRASNPRTNKRSLLQNKQTSFEADPSTYTMSTGDSLGVKQPGREAGHSPTSSGGVKNEWKCNSTPPFISYGVYRGTFTFTFNNLTSGKQTLYPFNRRLVRNQSKSGPYEERKIFLFLLVLEPRIVHP